MNQLTFAISKRRRKSFHYVISKKLICDKLTSELVRTSSTASCMYRYLLTNSHMEHFQGLTHTACFDY